MKFILGSWAFMGPKRLEHSQIGPSFGLFRHFFMARPLLMRLGKRGERMKKHYGKLFLGLMIAGILSFAGARQAHADCSVNSDCVFQGWYEDLAACKTNAYNNGYGYWSTGNSTNCADGNACIACYFCPDANKMAANKTGA